MPLATRLGRQRGDRSRRLFRHPESLQIERSTMRNSQIKDVTKRLASFAGDHNSKVPATKFPAADWSNGESSIADVIERSQSALTVRALAELLKTSDQTLDRMLSDHTILFFMVRGSY